jgi:hypothetical protein
VTSWTRCLSAADRNRQSKRRYFITERAKQTNIEQDCAVKLLVDDVGLDDLVVESLRCSFGSGHCAMVAPVIARLGMVENDGMGGVEKDARNQK